VPIQIGAMVTASRASPIQNVDLEPIGFGILIAIAEAVSSFGYILKYSWSLI
jgi:hypothetical protein